MSEPAEFDQFAGKYEETMERSCAVSGESPDFYAAARMRWCLRRLRPYLPRPTALDYGCGTGGSIGYFLDILGCRSVVGIDPSSESLRVAESRYPGRDIRLSTPEHFRPAGDVSLAFCNGVFHHILPNERGDALKFIRESMSDDGIFAFWENNPWNPVVVYGMSLNEFDQNAQTISPWHARQMLKQAGFQVLFTDFCFFFPHLARSLRGAEPWLRWVPLGAQYLIVSRKARRSA